MYVRDNFGRKILKDNAVLMPDGEYYNIKKNNPPLVVKNSKRFFTGSYEFYNPNIHVKYNNKYYNKYNMITLIKNNKKKDYPSKLEILTDISKKEYEKLIPGWDEKTKTEYYFLTEEDALSNGFQECYERECFVKNSQPLINVNKIVYKKFNNSKSKTKTKIEGLEYGVTTNSFIGTGGIKYTFGVEIETMRGKIPPWVYKTHSLNMDSTYDGSLKDPDGSLWGGEYVTGVLIGDAGLKNLYKCVREINKRCAIDRRCGIHVHIGGANFNETFTILAYILAKKIENEIFEIFPPSRFNNSFAGRLPEQDFLKNIKERGFKYGIEISYEKLFKELANGRDLDKKVSKFRNHPGGRYTDRYNGNIPFEKLYRYKWLNFIPCNFNTREKPMGKPDELNRGIPFTLEFRPHSASMNYTKIKNWLLFCMAFVSYVENFQDDIINNEKITIDDIIDKVFNKKTLIKKSLKEYFYNRKKSYKIRNKEAEILENDEYSERPIHNKIKTKDIILG